MIAATLANGGICPITDDPVLHASSIRDVLSLMLSCGMYDYSGHFAFNVGYLIFYVEFIFNIVFEFYIVFISNIVFEYCSLLLLLHYFSSFLRVRRAKEFF